MIRATSSGTMLRVIAACTIYGFACGAASAAKLQNSAFRAGRWDGNAYADAAGAFSHCAAMSTQPKSTLFLYSESADGSFYLAFARPAWSLPVGKTYTVSLSLDGVNWGAQEAVAYDTNAIQIGPLNQKQLATLRVGDQLKLTAKQEQIVVSLEDGRKAMDAVAHCVAHYRPGAPTNASVARSANPFEAGKQGDAQNDTQKLMSTLLENAGLSGTSWVDSASVGYKSAVLGWRSSAVEGALYLKEGDMSQMSSTLREKAGQECEGAFMATKPVSEVGGNTAVKSYEFVCEDGDATHGYAIVEVDDPKGKESVLVVNDTNGKANVTALLSANEKLRKMFVRLNKPDT